MTRWSKTCKAIGFFIITAIILAGASASAASFTISPGNALPGDTIELHFSDLPDDSELEISISGMIETSPSDQFSYELHDLVNNLGLTNASFSGEMKSLVEESSAKLEITREDGEKLTRSGTAVDGVWKTSISGSFYESSYNAIMTGEAETEKTPVTVTLKGMKEGTDDAICSFSLDGFTKGTFIVNIKVDGNSLALEKITIGE